MSSLEAFRRDTAAWLESNCPASVRGPIRSDDELVWGGRRQQFPVPAARDWLQAAAARGWTAPTWPREYGGGGLTAEEERVLDEEMRRIGARPPLLRLTPGLALLGPILLAFGTEDQKGRFLPPIVRGEVRWCQGFSEPSAGSDLASIRTRAVPDGEVLRLTGHKIWSSYAHVADWAFCLVRTSPTAPKHAGLSFLLVDLESPGVRIAPITLISGRSDFNELFFDDVIVPAENLVGELGQGWTIAKQLLDRERAALGREGALISRRSSAGKAAPEGGGLVAAAREAVGATSDGRLADDVLRDRIAGHLIRVRAVTATERRLRDAGRMEPALASMAKLIGTEAAMERQDLMVEIMGVQALGWESDELGDRDLTTARRWLRSRGYSIEGGTSEIQLGIISKQGLGLPDTKG